MEFQPFSFYAQCAANFMVGFDTFDYRSTATGKILCLSGRMVIAELASETREDLIQDLVQEDALLAAKTAAAYVHMGGAFSGLASGSVVEGSREAEFAAP